MKVFMGTLNIDGDEFDELQKGIVPKNKGILIVNFKDLPNKVAQ